MTQKTAATCIHRARALSVFGDSITNDPISPAGSIIETSLADKYQFFAHQQPSSLRKGCRKEQVK